MEPRAAQDWFTAAELAELVKGAGLVLFPISAVGWRDHAKREGWNDLPDRFSRERPRQGRPSMEYHLSILPDRLQDAVAGLRAKATLSQALATETEADRARVAAVRSGALAARARAVMEARGEVLTAIEGFAVARGQTRAQAIAAFLKAQAEARTRQETEARRDRGDILTAQEIMGLARSLILTAPDGFGLSLARLVLANDRRSGGAVARSTLYEWFKLRDEAGGVALAPATTRAVQAIPPQFVAFLKHYARPSKPSIADAHRAYLDEAEAAAGVQRMPLTLDQCAYILRKRLNNIERNVGREGLLTLRARLPFVTRTTEDMWPTTIYTADGKTFDAEVADPVSGRAMRPEITSVLDVATRKCVGVAVSRKENVIAVTEALRKACVAHGIPAIFYTDRGAGYKNKTFDAEAGGLMGRLGITKMHALPYNSQAKGIIERFNAVWNDVAKRLPTYIGADMDKEAEKAIHKATRGEIKVFGRSRTLPAWDDFLAMVAATVERYNARPHKGLPQFQDPATGKKRHLSPNEAWAAHVAAGFEPVGLSREEADDLFRPYELRMVRRGRIEWNTNSYFHPDLEAWHDRRVMVGYDLTQADNVWVREFDEDTGQPGRLICVARFGGNETRYMPRTQEQAAVETRARGQLRRLDDHRRAVEEQLQVPLLDMGPVPVEPPFAVPVPVPVTVPVEAAPVAAGPRRRVFASDEALAVWALAHPADLTPSQAAVLRDCLARPAARELFRLSGIDLDALRALLRAAA